MSTELVAADRDAAERRAMKISLRLDVIADNYEAVMPMIREAISLRDDIALGYRSAGEYVADRFGSAMTRLGVEVRREVVRELTAAGMSTRAIAPVVGVGQRTVVRDLNPGESCDSPEPAGTADDEWRCDDCGGVDGLDDDDPENCTCGEPDYERVALDAVNDARNRAPESQSQRVTGVDGKSYPAGPVVRAPRTDVVQSINSTILKVEQASAEAGKVRREHLRDRKDEAAVWSRRLESALTAVSDLLDTLREASS